MFLFSIKASAAIRSGTKFSSQFTLIASNLDKCSPFESKLHVEK